MKSVTSKTRSFDCLLLHSDKYKIFSIGKSQKGVLISTAPDGSFIFDIVEDELDIISN